jgi:hypothetical protein
MPPDPVAVWWVIYLSLHTSSNALARFDSSPPWSRNMARIKIAKKDGTPTPYFWSDKDGADLKSRTVYKQTVEGVKRMKGVRFNAVTNRMRRLA